MNAQTTAALHAAIHAHMSHPAGALADCGTESLCDEVLYPTGRPALDFSAIEADLKAADMPTTPLAWLVYAAVLALAIGASLLYPMPWGGA